MFRCPVTGTRLVKARAGGGTLWYSPDSDGRMLTVATARHFFGPDKTREIWMRSDREGAASEYGCPSCQNVMRTTPLPDWVGSSPIDVCRVCRIFWIDGSAFDEVPRGSQLPHQLGDSTLVKDLGEAYMDHEDLKAKREQKKIDGAIDAPDSPVEAFFTFLRLPVERSNRLTPEWPVISAAILSLMILLQIFFTDRAAIQNWGFYPGEPFKHFGLNIFTHVFLHGGWFHLIGNGYFTYVLSDDVEDDLGWSEYLGFQAFVILAGAVISCLISGARDIPHIGYSGVVMALFAYYGLQFPKAKMVWLLPRLRFFQFDTFHTSMWGWGWFQFRTLWVALFYLAGDTAYYLIYERQDLGSVSYSGHIAGFVAGALYWYIAAPKTFAEPAKRDVFESHMDSLITGEAAIKNVTSTKRLPKNPEA